MRIVANGFEEVRTEMRDLNAELKAELKAEIKETKQEILETKQEVLTEIQKTKLESLDRYATNERVDKHEIRIQKLETNIS